MRGFTDFSSDSDQLRRSGIEEVRGSERTGALEMEKLETGPGEPILGSGLS